MSDLLDVGHGNPESVVSKKKKKNKSSYFN